jgi:hypothetical protein|tara:strand:- start:339 stop:527 length:189 start_codon:yes stop_codon:yes gene_type:complete
MTSSHQFARTRFAGLIGGTRAKEDNHSRKNDDEGDMLWARTKVYLASVDFIDEAHLKAGFGD